MSQFNQIVKNIALENKKCGYNPEKGKNWVDLGWYSQAQKECWKRMDFKTRIRLSQTCRIEQFRFVDHVRKFHHVVENIAAESAKSNYNPEKDTNWCHLPMEMRLECVKRMDFKTRCRFRSASQAEKSLVDSKKHQFQHFKIIHDEYDPEWNIVAHELYLANEGGPDYSCISAILKHAEVKNFKLETKDEVEVSPLLEHMEKFAPFGFKRVSVFCNSSTAFFIKNCPNLEKVDFCGKVYFSLDEILETPSLIDVKELKFAKVNSEVFLEFLKELVRKWIDNDVEIGKSIQFDMQDFSRVAKAISGFAEQFSDRVIEKTDKEIRIRMNNNTTQILFRQVGIKRDAFYNMRFVFEYCSCKVIPIDMPKSEYENGDGWIQAAYEKDLKQLGKLENAAQFDAEDEVIWGDEYTEEESYND